MSIGCGIACGLFRAGTIGPESKSMFSCILHWGRQGLLGTEFWAMCYSVDAIRAISLL